jgi:23S rRNA U2552 (ribose-2'-O)-methylase RlmE/FtsJ
VMSGGTADFFYREARRLKFVARSAFKLLEIQNKHRIIRPGGSVLDLGCAPGAFLQVACQFLGPIEKGGAVVGVDVKKVKVPADHCDVRVRTYCADVLKISATSLASLSPSGCGYSVIVSDMCPAVSGIGSKDAALSGELGLQALHLALGQPESDDELPGRSGGILLPGGSLVIKLLEGEESQAFIKLCKGRFQQLSWLHPKATWSMSKEIYFINKECV